MWMIGKYSRRVRTWGQALLKLVGLVGVLQDQRVEEAVASDLELDLLGLAVALNAGGYFGSNSQHVSSKQIRRGEI